MNKTLLDNTDNLKMVDALNKCIETPETNFIRIATGYWDIPGMSLIIDELETFLQKDNTKLRLLIGKDPYVYANMLKEPKYMNKSYPEDFIRTNIDELVDNLKEEHIRVINLLLKYCDETNKKIEIRIFKKNADDESQFLHSKCYIFTCNDDNSKQMHAIVGSSNFTQKGLEGNAELNVLENDTYMINAAPAPNHKGHITWFEEKWDQAEDWTKEFLEQILKTSKPVQQLHAVEPQELIVDQSLTPYELYIKILQTTFGDLVDKNIGQLIESYLPQKYNPYDYQIDAVKQCFSAMKQHGGFMLADVVGLGKTVVGTLVIKHFLQYPDEDGRERKVLIVTPPAIKSSWIDTINDFDKGQDIKIAPSIDFITTGSIGKLVADDIDYDGDDIMDTGDFDSTLNAQNYGLIIIDESHKFRNSGTSMYNAIDNLIEQIGAETGSYPYIGLLSATPQNNRPDDLKNQIYLFERNHTDSTLKKANGGNIESFFAEISREFKDADHEKVKVLSLRIRDCILSDVMVRRTRTDVQKYYKSDIEAQGITFPIIEGPISLEYKMSSKLAHLFADTMNCISPTAEFKFDNSEYLCYYRYRAIQFFVNPDTKKKYGGRGSIDADKLSEQLAKIMQILLVKRLESSFTAFKQSLQNLRKYTENMIMMWENNTIFICPDFNVNAELDVEKKKLKRNNYTFADCVEDIRQHIQKLNEEGRNDDQNNMEYTRDDFDPAYIKLIKLDLALITNLCDRWGKITADPKRYEFMNKFKSVLMNPVTNRPQKLVIFSEAKDTVNDIQDAISEIDEDLAKRTLVITASNRDKLELTIRKNFDANYGQREGETQEDKYNIIITTDVLAEGVNLHRANCILNYDTPWNSTRLMQRIGRVNRIGSTEGKIYVYNFMPSAEGNAEIQLVQKAHTKLQSFHTLFGEDSKIFSDAEEISHYDLNTEVNGEESPLEKYIYELKQYKEQNPVRYKEIENTEESLEMSSAESKGCGYFLVRSPKMTSLFVRVNPDDEEGDTISLYDFLELARPVVDAEKQTLPERWEEMKCEAERVVVAELASIHIRQSNCTRATNAKEVIKNLKQTQQMSVESKKLLNAADRLIRQGNMGMVRRIIQIGKAIDEQNLLIPYSQEDFDMYIANEIKIIVENVQKRNGKPEVYIGMYNK